MIPLGVLNILVSYNDFVIGEHEDFIVCKNYKEDNLLWKFPLSELGVDPYESQKVDSIKDILGVVNGYLWIQTGAYKIIALNLENGNKKVVTEGFHAYLDKRNGKIYTLSSNIVAIIDTLNFIVEEEYNFLEEDSLGIGKYKSIYAPLHQGDYFTFIAEKENDYGGSRYIGVFDYAKRKLVWDYEVFTQEEINQTRNKLVPPQKLYITEDGRKMYIKDFHDTLYVFERE